MCNDYSLWSFFIFLANQCQKISLFSFLEPTDCIYFLCFIIDSYERMPVSYWLKYLQSLWPNSPINHSHGTQDTRGCFFFFRRKGEQETFLACCFFSFFLSRKRYTNKIRNFISLVSTGASTLRLLFGVA